jgi:CubicO group peptidase (beta-lactamase class C family)
VSGQSFPQFTAERIFKPLGMTHTQWRDDYTKLVPGLAQAYGREADGWHLNMPFDNIIGAGGLLTTVGDWLIWNDALTKKTLGSAVGDSITRQMKLTNGVQIQYAMGLVVTRYRGLREIQHSGSTAGYSTFLARYPDQDNLSIAVMCNAAGANATAYTHSLVMRWCRAYPMHLRRTPWRPIPLRMLDCAAFTAIRAPIRRSSWIPCAGSCSA